MNDGNSAAAPRLVMPEAEAKQEPTKYWRVTVCFGPQATLWAFLYKTRESVDKALVAAGEMDYHKFWKLIDDFGQSASFIGAPHGVMIDDMSGSGLAGNLIQLQNARNQARMNDLVLKDTDPELQKAIKQGRAQALHQQFIHGMPPGPMPRA